MSIFNIYKSSSKGNLVAVQYLVDNSVCINAQDLAGKTPLYYAVKHNKLSVVEYLLQKQADPNGKSSLEHGNTCTPLIAASCGGHSDIISCLLKYGAMINLPDEENSTALWCAASKGQFDTVFDLITHRAQINKADNKNITPLSIAAEFGHTNIVICLAEAGAEVNTVDKYEQTPISVASLHGHHDTVEFLCKHNAKINQRVSDSRTPLFLACLNNHFKVIHCLLENGADANICDSYGRSPLHLVLDQQLSKNSELVSMSSYGQYMETISHLCNSKANVNTAAQDGSLPLHMACKRNHYEVVQILLRHGADVDTCDINANTSLHMASQKGFQGIIDLLLQNKVKLNKQNNKGETPLFLAARCDFSEIVNTLVENGADVNLSDSSDRTPLFIATCIGEDLDYQEAEELLQAMSVSSGAEYLDTVKFLCKHGAEVDSPNEDGTTPLMAACWFNKRDIAECLVAHGADVNACDENNARPLMFAAGRSATIKDNSNKDLYFNICLFLIQNGANVNLTNKDGLTPLMLFCFGNESDTVRCLVEHGAVVNACDDENNMTALLCAAAGSTKLEDEDHKDKFLDIVSCLCKNGADVNATADGGTALMGFCVGNNVDTVQCLIEHGADIDCCIDGDTALHLCCMSGQKETAQFLLQNKAKINEPNEENQTPLWIAAANGFSELVNLLIANGANVNIRDCKNRSPLFVATSTGICIEDIEVELTQSHDQYIECVKSLCRNGADLNLSSEDGITPLMLACILNNPAMVQCLLELEADIDTYEVNGCTALHFASGLGHKAVVQLLLKHRPKLVKSKIGETPLDLAQEALLECDTHDNEKNEDFKEMISLLQSYKLNYKTDKDSKNLVPEEKTESNFIPKDILRSSVVENIVKNILKKERKREGINIVPELFKGKGVDDYLKKVWPDINNAGKEIHREKPRNDLTDTRLLKLAKEMQQDWRMIGGFLEVAHTTISELATEYKADPVYAAWTMLVRWRDSAEGDTAGKREQLRAVLLQLEREDIVDML